MIVQVRTDNHVENSEALAESVRAEVEGALGSRYGEQLRRVEVYLQDTNSHKGGVDKRCTIEAHLAGYPAVAVHDVGVAVEDALSGAVDKLLRTLDSKKGRLDDRDGRVSMSGEPT